MAEKIKKNSQAGGDKSLWLENRQIEQISERLGNIRSVQYPYQYQLIFNLLILTGEKFSRLEKSLMWGDLNLATGVMRLNGRVISIPQHTISILKKLRETAISETSLVIKVKYKKFWSKFARACVQIGIGEQGVLILRNTFIRKHFLTFQSLKRLKADLNISTLKYLPKKLFENIKPIPLFAEVL